jgi:hypothetical protein
MSDTSENPKKGFDLADFHRSTLEEMEITPLGRVLVGLFTVGAMTDLEKAQARKEGISDLDLVRVLFRSVVEIPLAQDSWEGRPITDLEVSQVPVDQLEAFAAAGLGRQHWKIDFDDSECECEPQGSAIEKLARRIRSHLEYLERHLKELMRPLPEFYSDSTRTLFQEAERMSKMVNLERPFRDDALSKILDSQREIDKALNRLQPSFSASEILRKATEMAKPFEGMPTLNQSSGLDLGITEILHRTTEKVRPFEDMSNLSRTPELKIPHIPSIADYVRAVSKEGRETREQIGKLNTLMELINQLFHSALADNEKKQQDDERRWRRDFYLALMSVFIATLMGIGSIFYTHFSGRAPSLRQELMLKTLQEQNKHLVELVEGQKRLEPRTPALPPHPAGENNLGQGRKREL